MGQSKGGGYEKLTAVTPGQEGLLNQLMQAAFPNQQSAAEGFQQFLPGGGGGAPIAAAANKNFQQQTIPSILNSFGAGAKGSSALNQALAAGASNLNTDLAAQLSQMQLQAASGLGGLGTNQAQQGISKDQFAYAPQQTPQWLTLLQSLIPAAGQVAAGAVGGPVGLGAYNMFQAGRQARNG